MTLHLQGGPRGGDASLQKSCVVGDTINFAALAPSTIADVQGLALTHAPAGSSASVSGSSFTPDVVGRYTFTVTPVAITPQFFTQLQAFLGPSNWDTIGHAATAAATFLAAVTVVDEATVLITLIAWDATIVSRHNIRSQIQGWTIDMSAPIVARLEAGEDLIQSGVFKTP